MADDEEETMIQFTLNHLSHCFHLLTESGDFSLTPVSDFSELLETLIVLYDQLRVMELGVYQFNFDMIHSNIRYMVKHLHRQAKWVRKQMESRLAGHARLERYMLMDIAYYNRLPTDCQSYLKEFLTPMHENWIPDHGKRQDWIVFEAAYIFSKHYGWEVLERWETHLEQIEKTYACFYT